ncbi:MAG TPA: hypothetical protein VNC78_08795 [Actinomycetota bacterium]|nr:hypothetical protein [Actinomycetota bacterium]
MRNQAASHAGTGLVVVAFLVRVGLAVVVEIWFGGSLTPDDSTYSEMARQAALGETQAWDPYTHSLYHSTATFLVPLTAIYKVFGGEGIAGQIFVAALGAGTAYFTYRVAEEFLAPRWALAAGAIVALLPSQVVWSSTLLKDAAVWFLLSALALVVARAGRAEAKKLILAGLLASLILFLLGYLRLHTLVVASWAVALAAAAGDPHLRLARMGGGLAVALVIPLTVGIGPGGLTLVTDAGSLQARRINNAVGANTAFIDIPSPSPTPLVPPDRASGPGLTVQAPSGSTVSVIDPWAVSELPEIEVTPPTPPPPVAAPADDPLLSPDLAHLPRGLAVMLLEPTPWGGGSTQLRFARKEALVWYPIVILALVGLAIGRRHARALAFPVLAGGGILLMYALTEGNIGTAFRHRGEFVWVVALLAAAGAAAVVRAYQTRQGSGEK